MATTGTRLRRIAQRAGDDRDRVIDLLRLASITLVIVGHWLVAAVLLRDGELVTTQVIAIVPETRPLTWLFQVMPVFFAVGGAVNRGSWQRARDDGRTWAGWLQGRARRLLVPLVPLLALWTVVVLAADLAGVRQPLLDEAARAALLPLWFLAVYLGVVALTPLTVRLHERAGGWALLAATVLIVAGDAAARTGPASLGGVNYLLVWGGIHQLGYAWEPGRWAPRRAALVAVGAWTATVGLIVVAGYPASMVAVDGAAWQNTDPPSLALWTFAIGQLAGLVAGHTELRRVVEDDRRYGAVVAAGGSILTLFLWHMTALVIVAASFLALDVWPVATTIDATWWTWRPAWMAACAVTLAALWAIARRTESVGTATDELPAWRATVGVPATVGGIAWLMTGGLTADDGGLAVAPVLLTSGGLWALGVLRRGRTVTPSRPQVSTPRRSPSRGPARDGRPRG